MKLTTKLAWSQITRTRSRTSWTLAGIVLATMMIAAVFGFAQSAIGGIYDTYVQDDGDWHLQFQWIDHETAVEVSEDVDIYNAEIISGKDGSGTVWYGVRCRLVNPTRDYIGQFQTIAERHGVEFDLHFCKTNDEILNLEGYGNSRFTDMAYGIAAVLALLIGIMSITVISNAFKVSAGERIRQFGLLKSVGATESHVLRIVLNEGLILSAIGIPIGTLAGLGLEAVALMGANQVIETLSQTSGMKFRFVASPIMIALTAVFAFATVILSAYLPARKVAKVTAIDAIRQSGEVKLSANQVKTSRIIKKLFGFEGTLAVKSLNRNKRAYRATIASLTMSIVLLLACGEFSYSFMKTVDMDYGGNNYMAGITYFNENVALPFVQVSRLTERFEQYNGAVVRFQGYELGDFKATLTDEMLTDSFIDYAWYGYTGDHSSGVAVKFVTVDKATYEMLQKQANVAYGEPILLNKVRSYHSNEKTQEYVPFHFKPMTLDVRSDDGSVRRITLYGEARELPTSLLNGFQGVLVLLPEADITPIYWYVDVQDSAGFTTYASEILSQELPEQSAYIYAYDIQGERATQMAIVKLVTTFVYGFVGLLTLISLTNVISVISANTRLRAREFAVLQSVGMTRDGLKRMLSLESLLYASKSLVYGLALGEAVCVGLHYIFTQAADFDFVFPWTNAAACIIGTFAITWITMRFSASRLKGGSIVEAIRE